VGGGGLRWIGAALCLAALPVHAFELDLPRTATLTASRDSALDQVGIPIGPFVQGVLDTRQFEGEVTRRAYRINAPGLTPLQILAPLRQQVEEAGFNLVLDCNQITCGGYDFRFAIDVLPAPNMYVNIRNFHFLTAIDDAGGEAITLLASAANGAGYLQVIRAGAIDTGATGRPDVTSEPTVAAQPPTADTDVAGTLLSNGFMVLHDIDFAVGTTSLDGQTSPELAALAELLAERPSLRLAIVGHTDTLGGLSANIAVSRARAQSVRDRLIQEYGVAPNQIEAEGTGYLAPRASNLTTEGREANRRVEVVVVSDDG
jgi:OOP family OmpA-OmpF porin